MINVAACGNPVLPETVYVQLKHHIHIIYTVIQTARKTSGNTHTSCLRLLTSILLRAAQQHSPLVIIQGGQFAGSESPCERWSSYMLRAQQKGGTGQEGNRLPREMMLRSRGHFAYRRAHAGAWGTCEFCKKWGSKKKKKKEVRFQRSACTLQWKSLSRKLPFCLFTVFTPNIFSKFLLCVRAAPGTREATNK